MNKVLKIHSKDNVLVVLQDLEKGETVFDGNKEIEVLTDVSAKHKVTTIELQVGDPIIMYGVTVGKATHKIPRGEKIDVGNIIHDIDSIEIKPTNYQWQAPIVNRWKNKTFNGYHRDDGKVGVANYWIVVPLVFCENRNIEMIKKSMLHRLGYEREIKSAIDISELINLYDNGASEDELSSVELAEERDDKNRIFKNIDGIKFLTHQGGCGGTRNDSRALTNLIAGYIANPNVAGATILSLGCQHAQISMMQDSLKQRIPSNTKPVLFFEQQQSKNERAFISDIIKSTFIGLAKANEISRKPAPLSKLVVGLECGGSDGFSGISANPALGYTSDLVNALGGATILSEFPELNGVEQELINRCVDERVAHKFNDLMNEYQEQAAKVGSAFEFNPCPGNIRDGLITDAIKSAGAAKKGGTAPIVDVLDYTELVEKQGLHLLCTPGNDVESTTGMAGSGANVIVFTSGLGTPTGNPISPVIKVSSNTTLYKKMTDIIDIDAGPVIDGKATIEEIGIEILECIIKVANGEMMTKAQQLNQDDFIPWKREISL